MTEPITLEASSIVPDLRIVRTESVMPHEHHDGQRLDPLAARIRADGRLKNPPVVATLSEDRYVVLDGANRVTALKALSIPHCLVQVVPYTHPFVDLHTWHHAITNIDADRFDARVAAIEGLRVSEDLDLINAQAQLARRVLLSYYIRADGSVVTLEGSTDLLDRTNLLNQVVSIYLTDGRLHRSNSKDIEELHALYPDLCAVMIFPSYEPVEILELAADGAKIPPGLTRHIIQGRAMRVNFPLESLESDKSLEEKNADLGKWVQNRLHQKRVRFYAESTFLFDE